MLTAPPDKLLATAQERWRRFNGHQLVADVLDGVKFKDGIQVTDDDNHDDGQDERVAARSILSPLIHNI